MAVSLISRRGIGQYSATHDASGGHLFIAPKNYKGDGTKRGVLFCHPLGGSSMDANGQTNSQPNMVALLYGIAQAGYPILSPDLGGANTWGNSTSTATFPDAVSYLTGTLGAKTGKVLVVGQSMGAAVAMNSALANPTLVQGMQLWMPVSDLQDIVTNNRGGFAASVNTAYGGTYSNASFGATSNPAVYGASLSAIPAQLWYGTSDTTVVPSTVTGVATLAGWTDLHPVAAGHGNAQNALYDLPTIISWLDAHA